MNQNKIESNQEFAKEFLKRLIQIKQKQNYRNQINIDLEAEKFERALKQLEEKSKIVEMREQIKEKSIVKSTEVSSKEEKPIIKPLDISPKEEAQKETQIIPARIIKPTIQETKQPEQIKIEEKPKTELPKILIKEAAISAPPKIPQFLPPQQPIQPPKTQFFRPAPPPTTPTPIQKVAITPAPPTPTAPLSSLTKLEPLIKDPTIQTIECPGENKPIIINRFGSIQTTSITLNKEEIDNVLKELSEKTRIPLTTGVFKVAYGSIIFTATISEFVGTRFIIQRKEFA
ncbi:MAG: hypothetical protein N3D20_00825 [Candidatus Pacearchaeota archaeon]|nr:hypothetical protein [Candidatus Pacearchaeota archaeon]